MTTSTRENRWSRFVNRSRSHVDSNVAKRLNRRAGQRGFTLAELLIAVIAGAIVFIGAFAFAKQATRNFQQEMRIAQAMFANQLAFRRMVSDVQRAGFLASPNIQRDYQVNHMVCVTPDNPMFPAGIKNMVGLRVERGVNNVNGILTDRLTITGSFSNNEPFPARSIDVQGAGYRIYLQPNSGAMQRAITQEQGSTAATSPATVPQAEWDRLFPAGRVLRIVDQAGFQHFGIIQSAGYTNNAPFIQLESTPSVYLQGAPPAGVVTNPSCTGVAGLGVGIMVNTINTMVYELAALRTFNENGSNPYATLYSPAASASIPDPTALPGENTRFELVRYETLPNGNRVAGTTELVSEYGVDLKVKSLMADNNAVVGSTLTRVTPEANSDLFDQLTGLPSMGAASIARWNSERIRSLHIRLVVRSRDADRDQTLTFTDGQVGRVAIPNTTLFARARTLQSEITLPNHTGVLW